MTNKIVEMIAKISKLENELKMLLKEQENTMNEKASVISKEGMIDSKLTYKGKEVSEAWASLKELIVKGE